MPGSAATRRLGEGCNVIQHERYEEGYGTTVERRKHTRYVAQFNSFFPLTVYISKRELYLTSPSEGVG